MGSWSQQLLLAVGPGPVARVSYSPLETAPPAVLSGIKLVASGRPARQARRPVTGQVQQMEALPAAALRVPGYTPRPDRPGPLSRLRVPPSITTYHRG